MKRGIIVIADGYETQEQQRERFAGVVDDMRAITPMTAEDRYYQLGDALADLNPGDQVVLAHVHYLGESLTHIVHALADAHAKGLQVVALADTDADEDVATPSSNMDTGAGADLARFASLLVDAERQAMAAQVAGLKKKAAARRSATPPKCIFIPVEFTD